MYYNMYLIYMKGVCQSKWVTDPPSRRNSRGSGGSSNCKREGGSRRLWVRDVSGHRNPPSRVLMQGRGGGGHRNPLPCVSMRRRGGGVWKVPRCVETWGLVVNPPPSVTSNLCPVSRRNADTPTMPLDVKYIKQNTPTMRWHRLWVALRCETRAQYLKMLQTSKRVNASKVDA